MVLAVTYPWAPASSYLSSQSVADSRCNPHATPRSSYSRRSPSRRFFLCRSALPCLALHRHCCLPEPEPPRQGRGSHFCYYVIKAILPIYQ